MTNMKRITVSFSDEIDDAIFALRKTDRFARCSYSEIVRQLVKMSLDKSENEDQENEKTA